MKKTIFISILAGLAAMSAGCGITEVSSSETSSSAEGATAAEEESAAEISTEEEATAEPTTVLQETTAEPTEESTEGAAAEITGSPQVSIVPFDGSWEVDGISNEYIFETAAGNFNYADLQGNCLASVAEDGRAYALAYAGGAAGSAYYDLYISADKGDTWTNCGPVREANGETLRFCLEDGSMVVFYWKTAGCEAYPKAFSYRLSGDGLARTDNETIFDGIVFDDGSSPSAEGDYGFTAEYIGDNIFDVFMCDNENFCSFYGHIEIDPVTLAVKSITSLQ